MPVIDYFYFHFKLHDFYFYFLFFYIFYFILFYLLFYFAWDFDGCAYGRWAAIYRKDHGWDFLVERYGSLETKVEATELTKNKIRRLLGRIMVLESKTPQRSREDFYTLKVENFRKIWITYGNQGQRGFSTTSGILVDYHFPKIIACTNNQQITRIIDSLRMSGHKFSSKWTTTFPTLEAHSRIPHHQEDQHASQISFKTCTSSKSP